MTQGQACCQRPIRVKTEEDIHIIESLCMLTMQNQTFLVGGDLPLVVGRKLIRSRFPKVSNTTVKYLNSKGVEKFKGSRTLKRTQRYPMQFGRSVF